MGEHGPGQTTSSKRPSKRSARASDKKPDKKPGTKPAKSTTLRTRSTSEEDDASFAGQGELLPEGKLYYRIGEVSRITGIKPHVLRYWETEFRWMAPPKSRSKQRLYRRKDIEMVLAIKKLLYDERYTIAGARQVIRERGVAKLLEEGVGTPPEIEAAAPVEVEVSAPEAEAHDLPERIREVRKELLALRSLLA